MLMTREYTAAHSYGVPPSSDNKCTMTTQMHMDESINVTVNCFKILNDSINQRFKTNQGKWCGAEGCLHI